MLLNVRNKVDPVDGIKCRMWERTKRSYRENKKSDTGYWVDEASQTAHYGVKNIQDH